jgi:hypothetical protein
MAGMISYFLLLNLTLLQIVKIQSKDVVSERAAVSEPPRGKPGGN